MALKTVTFRVPEEQLLALDSVAKIHQRDRSFVLNEALSQYLSLQDYHRELIELGIKEADEGKVVDHETVKKHIAEWARNGAKRP